MNRDLSTLLDDIENALDNDRPGSARALLFKARKLLAPATAAEPPTGAEANAGGKISAFCDFIDVLIENDRVSPKDGCRLRDHVEGLRSDAAALAERVKELTAALERIASNEPYICQTHAAVEITDEQLNHANRAQIQQMIARATLPGTAAKE